MNREFLEFYNRELRLLYERAGEFADAFPGVAERLGGLAEETMDPGLVGVLQGSAFMAARVQLKLKSEFSEFTTALLDQLVPNYLAPIPAAMLIVADPPYEDPALAEGKRFPAGEYLEAVYVEQERRVSCRFRLRSELAIWPLYLETATYHATPAPLQAMGLEVAPGVSAGLRLGLRRLTVSPGKERPASVKTDPPIRDVRIDTLPIHLVGTEGDATALYEQIFANLKRITIRYPSPLGDPQFLDVPLASLEQIGFGEDEALFEPDNRVFSGFELLREFFVFPRKFLGFRLCGLRRLLARIDAPAFDILFEFGAAVPRLASVVDPRQFALHAAPAINQFEMTCSRLPLRRGEHEHQLVPDASRVLDFEAQRIVDVFAHYPGRKDKVRVFPLYSLPSENVRTGQALYYTYRRLPRRPTAGERRSGIQPAYVGTDMFITLSEPATIDDGERARELSVRALVSNRHLSDQLPIGEAGADFFLINDTSIPLRCIAGPTPARESLVTIERRRADATPFGSIYWKLINMLQLSHLGLAERGGAGSLRELLSLFADLSDLASEQRIRGIEGVASRPIVRRLRQPTGFNAARGIEITVTFDERAFEGTGIFLIGAVLDRFFASYTSLNSFTETVIASRQRGVLKRWPARSGTGQPL